jgi:hypothetical protein
LNTQGNLQWEKGQLQEALSTWKEATRHYTAAGHSEGTQQALFQVETLQAPDIRYRWEWQLGRLLEKQGDIKGATAAYT